MARAKMVRTESYLFALLSRYFEYIHNRFTKLDSGNNGEFMTISQKWAHYFSSKTDHNQEMPLEMDVLTWSEREFHSFLEMNELPVVGQANVQSKQLQEISPIIHDNAVSQVYLDEPASRGVREVQ
jgi:hypothetical protein